MSVEEGHDAIVQELGRREWGLAIVEFGEGHLGIGVDERLLVDASDPLHVADVERVLRPAVARALALELAVRLLVRLGLLQRGKPAFGQDQALLGHLGLKRFEALLHRLEIVALPHPAHARRRDGVPLLAYLVGAPDLAYLVGDPDLAYLVGDPDLAYLVGD